MRPHEHVPPNLYDELMLEILSWLPVKSLLRFRCVCTSWKSFISDPSFVKLHLQRSHKNANFLVLTSSSENNAWSRGNFALSVCSSLENPSPSSTSTIAEDFCHRRKLDNYVCVGSCNGLVCLVGKFCRHVYGGESKEFRVRLCNPATRLRSEESPWLSVDSKSHQSRGAVFGFGYDNLNDTYKVIVALMDRKAKEHCKKTQVNVYSMGDKLWRKIQSFPDDVCYLTQGCGVYLSSTLNWLAVSNLSYGNQFVIVSLDLGKETWTLLLLPCGLDEVHRVWPTLGVLMDCLCFSHNLKGTHFVVWQMKEFGVEKSWTQLVNVSYQDLRIDCPRRAFLLSLRMFEDGDILIMMENSSGLHTLLYNWRDKRVRSIEISNRIAWIYNKDYAQSLVSPPRSN